MSGHLASCAVGPERAKILLYASLTICSSGAGNAQASQSIALGNSASANSTGSIAQGTGANVAASATNGIAIGAGSGTTGVNAAAVGPFVSASGASSSAYGPAANASGEASTAVGLSANVAASATNGIAIGAGSGTTGVNAAAVGPFASASGASSSAYGRQAIAAGENSAAIGQFTVVAAAHTNSSAFGAGAKTTTDNQVMIGTAKQSYTTPGITSRLSRTRQTGLTQVVTTDASGNLASDQGAIFKGLATVQAGVAIATAIESPELSTGENFGIRVGWGGFDSFEGATNAMGLSAIGVLGRNVFAQGDRVAVDAGIGLGWSEFQGYSESAVVAGRAGMQLTW